ncbi:MAG: S-methyl-5-thioribose-1-phosphate isomerase, partial [Planctomycetes bacterium]|nr:S-methyl-5-thioribose-1-phosphate isomerase [Planctomycetota bacterium]
MNQPPTRALKWEGGLHLLDQTRLPESTDWLHIQSVEQLISAIQRLSVRGAPAIGCAAAYGMVLAAQDCGNGEEWKAQLLTQGAALRAARPTAVNLLVGVDLMVSHGLSMLDKQAFDLAGFQASMLEKAMSFHKADEESCAAIGRHGASLLKEGARILTH